MCVLGKGLEVYPLAKPLIPDLIFIWLRQPAQTTLFGEIKMSVGFSISFETKA